MMNPKFRRGYVSHKISIPLIVWGVLVLVGFSFYERDWKLKQVGIVSGSDNPVQSTLDKVKDHIDDRIESKNLGSGVYYCSCYDYLLDDAQWKNFIREFIKGKKIRSVDFRYAYPNNKTGGHIVGVWIVVAEEGGGQ